MSWRETSLVMERKRFIESVLKGMMSVSEACVEFGVSRACGHKWLRRYREDGDPGLLNRSRAPLNSPNATAKDVSALIVQARLRWSAWGARKLLAWLAENHPGVDLPSPSTAGSILSRHGLVKARKATRHTPPYTQPFTAISAPNKVWSADFKGQFRMAGGDQVYPLTVTDGFSRYLLALEGLQRPNTVSALRIFRLLFAEYGLPEAILTDNGQPFASVALGGLTPLSAWWVRLGITPERIKPGHPEQNGRHERMHGAMERELVRPGGGLRAWRKAFDQFRKTYNDERPHEALGMKTPARVYLPSPRPYPSREPKAEYDSSFTVRRVRSNGEIKWKSGLLFVSESLIGEPVGFLPVAEGVYDIYYCALKLGSLDMKKGKIQRPVNS